MAQKMYIFYYMTNLIIACEENDLDLVRKLLQEGADINATDKYGNTALQYAVGSYNNIIAKELLKFENIDVNAQNNDGWTVLMSSCNTGNIIIFRELISIKGIDYNIQNYNHQGWTALMFACRWGHIEIIKELLQIDAVDIYIKNIYGMNVLEDAYYYYRDRIVKLLKERIYRDYVVIGLPCDITRLLVDYV